MSCKKIISFLLFIVTLSSFAQNFSAHKWENRILIIQSNTETNQNYQNQLKEFQNSENDFKDRKLVLYNVLKSQYKKIDYTKNTQNQNWSNASLLYEKILKKNDHFRILLIGLDGGIKLSQDHILKKSDLFNLIDSMPMRAAELQQNN